MKLLVFTPCQLVLQDPVNGQSLISVFHEIKIQVPKSNEVPTNAILPKEWSIFCKWEVAPEEQGKLYIANLEILWPDGNQFVKQALPAAQAAKFDLSFVFKLLGFPMGQSGRIKVIISLESDGQLVFDPTATFVNVDLQRTG